MRQLRAMIELRRETEKEVFIVQTIATEGVGLDLLKSKIDMLGINWKAGDRQDRANKRMQRIFAREVGQLIERKLATGNQSEFINAYKKIIKGDLNMDQIVEKIIAKLQKTLESYS